MIQETDISKLNKEEVEDILRKEYIQLDDYDKQIRTLKEARRLLRKDMRKYFTRLRKIHFEEEDKFLCQN